jgi:hypothetical protein
MSGTPMSDLPTATLLHSPESVRRGRRQEGFAAATGLLGPFLVAMALVPARGTLPNTDVALLLVAVIVLVAASGSRAAGLLATVSAAAWFDFFLTAPFERFSISRSTDLITTGLLLAVGAWVTEIAVRSRRHLIAAVTEGAYLEGIGSCVDLLARGAGAVEVVARVNRLLVPLLGVRSSRFATGRHPDPPAPEIDRDGQVLWGETVWDVERHGLPNEELQVTARRGDRVYGRFVLQPVVGTAPTRDARRAAVVLAQIAAAALAGGSGRLLASGSGRASTLEPEPEPGRAGVGPVAAGRAVHRTGLRIAAPRHS